jgi:hypothetical protein
MDNKELGVVAVKGLVDGNGEWEYSGCSNAGFHKLCCGSYRLEIESATLVKSESCASSFLVAAEGLEPPTRGL